MKRSNEIRRMASRGISQRQVAKALGIHRWTVERHLEGKSKEKVAAARPPSWVGDVDWDEIKAEFIKGVPGRVLFEEYRRR